MVADDGVPSDSEEPEADAGSGPHPVIGLQSGREDLGGRILGGIGVPDLREAESVDRGHVERVGGLERRMRGDDLGVRQTVGRQKRAAGYHTEKTRPRAKGNRTQSEWP